MHPVFVKIGHMTQLPQRRIHDRHERNREWARVDYLEQTSRQRVRLERPPRELRRLWMRPIHPKIRCVVLGDFCIARHFRVRWPAASHRASGR